MAHQEIKAVLFDLGDTLLNFGRISTTGVFLQGARTSYHFLKTHGQPVGSFAWYAVRNLVRLRLRQLRSDLAGRDFDSLGFLQKIGRGQGIQLSPRQWEQFAWAWYEPLSKLADVEHNVRETLDSLKQLGLKLGIVSNTFVNRESLERHMSRAGILEFFPVRLYSYEFAFRKPHLEIFRIAAERIGAALENVMFVGDRIDKDIEPALRSGMVAVLKDAYTNAGKQTPPGARRIRSLSELPGLIAEINAAAQPTRV
ncbi:MAG: HAD family hydrolase [Sedimentisphaerales bacterium]|nr:HAD family hydrolase [Sedimentisphaerales bacterium]